MRLFFLLFSGVPAEDMTDLPLIPIGRWLFPIVVYLMIVSFFFGRDKAVRKFVIFRYKRIGRWWRQHFWRKMLLGMIVATILPGLSCIVDIIVSGEFISNYMEILKIFILWAVHIMTMSAIFLFIESLNVWKLTPVLILLLEGFSILVGFRFRGLAPYMFGLWGMYTQSCMYNFSAVWVITTQVFIILGCYLLGKYKVSCKDMEGV